MFWIFHRKTTVLESFFIAKRLQQHLLKKIYFEEHLWGTASIYIWQYPK